MTMLSTKKPAHDLSKIAQHVIQLRNYATRCTGSTRRCGNLDPKSLHDKLFIFNERRHPYEDLCRIFGYSINGSIYGVAQYYADVNGHTIAERDAQIAEMVLAEAKRSGWMEAYTEEFLDRALSTIMDVNDPRWQHASDKDMRPEQFRNHRMPEFQPD